MNNKVYLKGKLGAEPEFKYTQNGIAILKISLGVGSKNKDGGWQTTWWPIVLFKENAETYNALSKGELIEVEGAITKRKWVDKQENQRETVEIIGYKINLVEPENILQKNEEKLPY